MTGQRLLFVCSHSTDEALGLEAFDAVLMALMLEQKVTLLFVGAGARQFTGNGAKALEQKLAQLASMGLEDAWLETIEQGSDYGKQPSSLRTLEAHGVKKLFHDCDKVLSF